MAALLAVGCGPGKPQPPSPTLSVESAPPARPTPTCPPDDQPDNPIVGQAGGQRVRLSEILPLEQNIRFGAPPPGRTWRDVVLEFRSAKLDDILQDHSILWKMDREGLRPRVESEVAKLVAERGEEGLKQSGFTVQSLTVMRAKALLQEPELRKLGQAPSDTDMRKYYEENKNDKFLTKEALSVRRIWRFPKPGQTKQQLRADMEQLRAQIEIQLATTTDINEQARIVSTFAKKYHEGKDRPSGGWIKHYRPGPSDESQAYLDAAYGAELYQLSPVLEVDGGFLLVFPDYHYPRRQIPYEEARGQILNMLVKERQETFQDRRKKNLLEEAGAAKYVDSLALHLPPQPASEPPPRPAPTQTGG